MFFHRTASLLSRGQQWLSLPLVALRISQQPRLLLSSVPGLLCVCTSEVISLHFLLTLSYQHRIFTDAMTDFKDNDHFLTLPNNNIMSWQLFQLVNVNIIGIYVYSHVCVYMCVRV